MIDINTTFQALTEPIATSIQTVTSILQWLVGGVFGIYLIMAVINFYNNKKQRKEMKDMKEQLTSINKTLIDIRELLSKKR